MEQLTAIKPEDTIPPSKTSKTSKTELTALAKCKAILAIWTEKTSISAVCREFSMQRPQVERLEALALEGMLRALEPRPRGRRATEAPREELPSRLEKLLERKFNPRPKKAATLTGKLEQAEKKVRQGRQSKMPPVGE